MPISEAQKIWRAENKEKMNSYLREWRRKNKEKVNEKQRAYRAEIIKLNTTVEEITYTKDGKNFKKITRKYPTGVTEHIIEI